MGPVAVVDVRGHELRIARSAGMAPSHHNSQPWSLAVAADRVEVWVEPDRRPGVSDPDGRQALIGVGAALYAIRLELGELGYATRVEPFPDPARPELVAQVAVAAGDPPAPLEHRLWQQLPRRRTVRTRMRSEVDQATRRALALHVAVEGCGLRWIEAAEDRRALAALVALAEREQQQDPRVLGELAQWTAAEALESGVGVPAYALGPVGEALHAAEFPLRDFRGGGRQPDLSVLRPEPDPAVAVLITAEDQPLDRLQAGQALMRLLLAATAEGLAASYLNQPLEQPGLRHQVRSDLALPGTPQLVLRLGRPAGVWPPAPPRRPPAELIRD